MTKDVMRIEHVVVLALKNRSFDHMLGFLDHPDPKFEGLKGAGPYDNPGWENGPRIPASDVTGGHLWHHVRRSGHGWQPYTSVRVYFRV